MGWQFTIGLFESALDYVAAKPSEHTAAAVAKFYLKNFIAHLRKVLLSKMDYYRTFF